MKQSNFNDNMSFDTLLEAAQNGNAEAQCIVGVCYFNGEGISQNYEGALNWFRKSAEQGDMHASYWLGSCYYNGKGVTQNFNEALKWFRKSAKLGNENAQSAIDACKASLASLSFLKRYGEPDKAKE